MGPYSKVATFPARCSGGRECPRQRKRIETPHLGGAGTFKIRHNAIAIGRAWPMKPRITSCRREQAEEHSWTGLSNGLASALTVVMGRWSSCSSYSLSRRWSRSSWHSMDARDLHSCGQSRQSFRMRHAGTEIDGLPARAACRACRRGQPDRCPVCVPTVTAKRLSGRASGLIKRSGGVESGPIVWSEVDSNETRLMRDPFQPPRSLRA